MRPYTLQTHRRVKKLLLHSLGNNETSKALCALKEHRGWNEEEERTRDNAPVEKTTKQETENKV